MQQAVRMHVALTLILLLENLEQAKRLASAKGFAAHILGACNMEWDAIY